jgi:hypothetical protein
MPTKSLRERLLAALLSEVADEAREAETQTPTVMTVSENLVPVSETGVEPLRAGICPRCGSGDVKDAGPGCGARCIQCGWQAAVFQPKGFSRQDFFSGELDSRRMRQPREAQLRPPGFATAIGRLFFGGR